MLIVFPHSRVVPLILSFPPCAKAEGSTVGKAMQNTASQETSRYISSQPQVRPGEVAISFFGGGDVGNKT